MDFVCHAGCPRRDPGSEGASQSDVRLAFCRAGFADRWIDNIAAAPESARAPGMVHCFLARVRVDHNPRHAARAFRFVDVAIAKTRRAENPAGATAALPTSGLVNFAGRPVSRALAIATAGLRRPASAREKENPTDKVRSVRE
jgi:hypothetical protein